jgi:hypothetical protein
MSEPIRLFNESKTGTKCINLVNDRDDNSYDFMLFL